MVVFGVTPEVGRDLQLNRPPSKVWGWCGRGGPRALSILWRFFAATPSVGRDYRQKDPPIRLGVVVGGGGAPIDQRAVFAVAPIIESDLPRTRPYWSGGCFRKKSPPIRRVLQKKRPPDKVCGGGSGRGRGPHKPYRSDGLLHCLCDLSYTSTFVLSLCPYSISGKIQIIK